LYKFSIDMNDIVVLFYFYCCRSESKRHVSCLFINIADFDKVPCEKLQESHLLLYLRFLAISPHVTKK